MQTRRTILSALSCGITGLAAGCVESINPLESPIKLAHISITNLSDSSHEFEIRVRRDNKTVHKSTHRLEADGGSVSGSAERCRWMDVPGTYVISCRLEDGKWVSQSVEEGVSGHPDFALVQILYDGWDRERLAFFIEPGSASASQSEENCQLAASLEE